ADVLRLVHSHCAVPNRGKRTMLAGVRDVAVGATIVMAGLLAVMLVGCAWIVLFLSYVPPRYIPGIEAPWDYLPLIVSANSESLRGGAGMMWLVGRTIGRVSKSRR